MSQRLSRGGVAVFVVFLLCSVAVGCSEASGGGVATGLPPASNPGLDGGRQLILTKCVRCHPIDRVEQARKNRAAWQITISRMRTHGLELTDAEMQQVLAYLASR